MDAQQKAIVKAALKKAINERPEFKSFLTEHQCEGKLIKAFLKQHKHDPFNNNSSKEQLTKIVADDAPLWLMLDWANTKEGYSYWAQMHNKCVDHLDSPPNKPRRRVRSCRKEPNSTVELRASPSEADHEKIQKNIECLFKNNPGIREFLEVWSEKFKYNK